MLFRWWPLYGLKQPVRLVFTLTVGISVLLIWIAPQVWFGASPRLKGFDPTFFGDSGPAYWATVILRFIRLGIVVPLLEEIFWRGYLLRTFIAHPFTRIPVGTFSWKSFGIVTAGFCLVHQPADWPAAIACGVLYNLVAYRTGSLSACILAHAITNFLLGLWIMHTGQWGFW
jgi:CAAX prenyl protease-like protein